MNGQRFDQLARALARGASRRRVFKGVVGGMVGGTCALLRTHGVRAQCSWSGIFETPFGGITMTLSETGGQVTGSYAFTEDNTSTNGTITGTVRTDFPGYTVLDGSWREPEGSGRLWFVMALDPCTQFTGSYTSTDTSQEWIAGWDGIRTSGVSGDGETEVTIFSNPGDSRIAAFTVEGQPVILFGPKDADGGAEYISQAWIDSADGDPQEQVVLDFDAAGTPTRAALGSGETMTFEWVSPTRVIITYQSADGSQEVQFPFDAEEAATTGTAAHALGRAKRARGGGEVRLLAYSGVPDMFRTLNAPRAAHQPPPPPHPFRGIIEVTCGSGQLLEGAGVVGSFKSNNPPSTILPLGLWPKGPGTFEYTLPLRGPALTPNEGHVVDRADKARSKICSGSFAMTLTGMTPAQVCAALLGVPAVGPEASGTCAVIIAGYRVICGIAWGASLFGARVIGFFSDSLEVTAEAWHPLLGRKSTTFTATANLQIPKTVIGLQGGGIGTVTIEPPDPVPEEGYVIRVGTICVVDGSQLTVSVAGSDNFATSTTATIAQDVKEATLSVPGGAQGVRDVITVELFGPIKQTKTRSIEF